MCGQSSTPGVRTPLEIAHYINQGWFAEELIAAAKEGERLALTTPGHNFLLLSSLELRDTKVYEP